MSWFVEKGTGLLVVYSGSTRHILLGSFMDYRNYGYSSGNCTRELSFATP